jgi:hypothetical protein
MALRRSHGLPGSASCGAAAPEARAHQPAPQVAVMTIDPLAMAGFILVALSGVLAAAFWSDR